MLFLVGFLRNSFNSCRLGIISPSAPLSSPPPVSADRRIKPERVIIDHVEEHTVKMVLDAGFWAGMTLYPESKCTAARAVDILEVYGSERLWMNSACDWGVSVPLAVPRAGLEMRKRGHSAEAIDKLIYQNPARFMSQCEKFKLPKA